MTNPRAEQLHRELINQLAPGERLIWYGQPSGKRMKGLFGAWLFAVPWTLFACFFIYKWYTTAQMSAEFSLADLLPLSIPFLFVLTVLHTNNYIKANT